MAELDTDRLLELSDAHRVAMNTLRVRQEKFGIISGQYEKLKRELREAEKEVDLTKRDLINFVGGE